MKPPRGTPIIKSGSGNSSVVERRLAEAEVAGSSPVSRSSFPRGAGVAELADAGDLKSPG